MSQLIVLCTGVNLYGINPRQARAIYLDRCKRTGFCYANLYECALGSYNSPFARRAQPSLATDAFVLVLQARHSLAFRECPSLIRLNFRQRMCSLTRSLVSQALEPYAFARDVLSHSE